MDLGGLQHMTFQPLLLNFPTALPSAILPRYTYVDDDELAWRVCEHYGGGAIVKLRYIIAKFDVGHMPGGLQTGGEREARQLQAQQAHEVVQAHPEAFQIARHSSLTGRLGGARARLRVDLRDQHDILMNGQSLAKVIEKRVRESTLHR